MKMADKPRALRPVSDTNCVTVALFNAIVVIVGVKWSSSSSSPLQSPQRLLLCPFLMMWVSSSDDSSSFWVWQWGTYPVSQYRSSIRRENWRWWSTQCQSLHLCRRQNLRLHLLRLHRQITSPLIIIDNLGYITIIIHASLVYSTTSCFNGVETVSKSC